jgi:hypothetical protein
MSRRLIVSDAVIRTMINTFNRYHHLTSDFEGLHICDVQNARRPMPGSPDTAPALGWAKVEDAARGVECSACWATA